MFELGASDVGDLATWVSVGFTVIAGVAASVGFTMLRRRERRQALTELHISLTSGETAQARNTIGALLYSKNEHDRPEKLRAIEAYFALIWALQRARNVFRTYSLPWRSLDAAPSRLSELSRVARKDASIALTWNLTEIAESVVYFHDRFHGTWGVEDEDAWNDISTFVNPERLRVLRAGLESGPEAR